MLATLHVLVSLAAVPQGQECGEPQCLCQSSSDFGQCNLADAQKKPPVGPTLPTGPSIETGIASAADFEHALGHGLRSTMAVQRATQEFAQRVFSAFVQPHPQGSERYAEVDSAFGSASRFDQSNTGWVGPNPHAIVQALQHGNIREVWALVYALTKTQYLDHTVAPPDGSGALLVDETLLARGLAPGPLRQRAKLVNASNTAAGASSNFNTYAQGVPDFAFPGFDSWVRFDFGASKLDDSGNPVWLWDATREWVGGRTTLMSNDPSIVPPLSDAELDYQCGETVPCQLHWTPGMLGFRVPTTPFSASGYSPGSHGYLPGYAERATALGYRTVAGPSGTTQNVLQYATYFGMGKRCVDCGPSAWRSYMQEDDWLPLIRLTMLAWMLPTDDHSLYEIMLGAEPYMGEEFKIAQGLDDMSRLCPSSRTLTVTTVNGDALRFPCADIWANVNSFVNVTSPFVHGWSLAQRQAWNELMSAVSSECDDALTHFCSRAKRSSAGDCFICTGEHQQAFREARCTQHDFDNYCGGKNDQAQLGGNNYTNEVSS